MLRVLRRLTIRLCGDPPDPAWVGQRPIVKYATYDAAVASHGDDLARLRAVRIRRAHAVPNLGAARQTGDGGVGPGGPAPVPRGPR